MVVAHPADRGHVQSWRRFAVQLIISACSNHAI